MPKQVRMPDGNIINFPDDMDNATIHAEGLKYVNSLGKKAIPAGVSMMGPSNQYKGLGDEAIDLLRPIVAGTAGTAAAAIPFPGTGPAAYTGADYLMQMLKEEKTTPEQKLLNTGLQAILGKLFNLGGKAVGAVRNSGIPDPEILKFSPTAAQAMKAEKIPGAGVVKIIEDALAPGAKQEALSRSGKEVINVGNKLAGKIAGRSPNTISNFQQMPELITGELAPASESKMIAGKLVPVEEIPAAYSILPGVTKKVPFATDAVSLDKLLNDAPKLQQALTKSQAAGLGINVKQDLAGYRLSRILANATDTATGQVNLNEAERLFNSLPETNKILYNSTTKSNIEQFFKVAKFAQEKGQGAVDTGAKWALRSGMAYLPAKFIYSALAGNTIGVLGAAGITGVELGGTTLAKAFTKPETARILIRLAGAEPLGMSDSFAGKIILNGLNGSAISLLDAQGQKHDGIIKDGKVEMR